MIPDLQRTGVLRARRFGNSNGGIVGAIVTEARAPGRRRHRGVLSRAERSLGLLVLHVFDAVLTGVETRASPVRIVRDESFEASVGGLYPAGEGAGYSGGIMSSAVDGDRPVPRGTRGAGG